MLFQIVSLLLDVACGLLTGVCLLRLYMQMQRISFSNPVGQMVFALSDWLVIPLRKIVPSVGRWDLSCLIGALLAQLLHYGLLAVIFGVGTGLLFPFILALFGVLRVAVTGLMGLMGLIIANSVLSWVQTRSPISGVIERLCAPILNPLRRVIPLLGGIDFSPLVALLALQVVTIVLGNLQMRMLT